MTITTTLYDTPCGRLLLGGYGDRLCMCRWMCDDRPERRIKRLLNAEIEEGHSAITDLAAKQLDEYFEGCRQSFDVPLIFAGSDFQKSVWQSLTKIPYGHTISYAEQARRIGHPGAFRAAAAADGANAIAIIVPCHRVIGSDGSITGYAGGVQAKEWLIRFELKGNK